MRVRACVCLCMLACGGHVMSETERPVLSQQVDHSHRQLSRQTAKMSCFHTVFVQIMLHQGQ